MNGCTQLRYEAEFGLRGWVLGWLLGVLYVRPKLKKLMRGRLKQMKATIEARARESQEYPQKPCTHEEAGSYDIT